MDSFRSYAYYPLYRAFTHTLEVPTQEKSSLLPFDDFSESTNYSTSEKSSEDINPLFYDPEFFDLMYDGDSPVSTTQLESPVVPEQYSLSEILNRISQALKRNRKSSLKGRVLSKFLDCLKKKPLKLARKLMRKAIAGKLPKKFQHFALLNEDPAILNKLVYSEYWPSTEWPVNSSRKHKSFNYQCVFDLLTETEADFKGFYDELIDWHFNASKGVLEKFLGLYEITQDEKEAFYVFFIEIVKKKCISI